jgi:hypothetical protein
MVTEPLCPLVGGGPLGGGVLGPVSPPRTQNPHPWRRRIKARDRSGTAPVPIGNAQGERRDGMYKLDGKWGEDDIEDSQKRRQSGGEILSCLSFRLGRLVERLGCIRLAGRSTVSRACGICVSPGGGVRGRQRAAFRLRVRACRSRFQTDVLPAE